MDVNHRYVSPIGFALGCWIQNTRTKHKQGLLTDERASRLDEIGMIWNKFEFQWEWNFAAAEKYFLQNSHLQVPSTYIDEDGVALGAWIVRCGTG